MPPNQSDWLSPHLAALSLRGERLLELGSGRGDDAEFLVARGARLVASELHRGRVQEVARRVPTANTVRLDHAHALPFRDDAFDAVVASLTMHYMNWRRTLAAFAEIRRVLVHGGAFLFRVNASGDFAHGAGQGEELEPGFFRLSGRDPETKRFFDEPMVRACLADGFWIASLQARKILWDGRTKSTWECLAHAER